MISANTKVERMHVDKNLSDYGYANVCASNHIGKKSILIWYLFTNNWKSINSADTFTTFYNPRCSSIHSACASQAAQTRSRFIWNLDYFLSAGRAIARVNLFVENLHSSSPNENKNVGRIMHRTTEGATTFSRENKNFIPPCWTWRIMMTLHEYQRCMRMEVPLNTKLINHWIEWKSWK